MPDSQAKQVLLLEPADADLDQIAMIRVALDELIAANNLTLEERTALTDSDLNSDLRIVVVLGPDPGLQDLATAMPRTQFVGIGIPGIHATSNLSVIGSDEARPDQLGFAAGYLAAAITDEWRVGVIGLSDTAPGVATRQGFINGAIYFCGLCKQVYPPYYSYPLYVEMPASASSSEWQSAGSILVDRAVKTVFIAPGAGDSDLFSYLAGAGVNLIGSGPPPAALKDRWVASIRPGYATALKALWPNLLDGSNGSSVQAVPEIGDLNPDLLSPGRQRLVNNLLNELVEGYIDTGVDQGN